MTNVTHPASDQPWTLAHWIAQVVAQVIVPIAGIIGCAFAEAFAEVFAIARNQIFANRHPNLL